MAASAKRSKLGPGSRWEYGPDPSRTTFYLLLAVGAVLACQWVPEFAQQLEQQRFERQIDDVRTQTAQEYERWRRRNPRQAQRAKDEWLQAVRQAEQRAAGNMQFALPMEPMPGVQSESSTPASLN